MSSYLYHNTETGQFNIPVSVIRSNFPNVSIPEDILSIGTFKRYRRVTPPTPNQFQRVEEDVPMNGLQRWKLVQLTSTELLEVRKNTLADIRARRDALLKECDWTQMADTTIGEDQRQLWKQYRDQLRRITDSYSGQPIIWPSPPGEA